MEYCSQAHCYLIMAVRPHRSLIFTPFNRLLLIVMLVSAGIIANFKNLTDEGDGKLLNLDIDPILPPNGDLLKEFMVVRPPGSERHRNLQSFIQKYFTQIGWHFEVDRFSLERTVLGKPMEFTNLIATSDPAAPRRIILAAHYDSKLTVEGGKRGFLGATDSAWPCAVIMQLAASIPLSQIKGGNQTALQVVLFDGEEALLNWSIMDSLYGSRHLAKAWATATKTHHRLNNIDAFILLDLLGAKGPKIYPYSHKTLPLFNTLSSVEMSLRQSGKLKTQSTIFISGQAINSYTEDDHVPFAERNVPILHLIPLSFPSVWHRMVDDMSALHCDTCHDLFIILYHGIVEILTSKRE